MSEELYDREFAPVLLELARKAEQAGMSFVATVEWAPGEGGSTVKLQEKRSISIEMAAVCARARNNADTIALHLMKLGHKHGHASVCLEVLGVPLKPEPSP